MLAGQVIDGGVVSTNVTVVVQVLLKPESLVTVMMMVYAPGVLRTVPAAGF